MDEVTSACPPRLLAPGLLCPGSSSPDTARRGGGGDLVHYSTPMHHAADTHTHTDTITHPRVQAAKHPSITSLDSSGETEDRFSNRKTDFSVRQKEKVIFLSIYSTKAIIRSLHTYVPNIRCQVFVLNMPYY